MPNSSFRIDSAKHAWLLLGILIFVAGMAGCDDPDPIENLKTSYGDLKKYAGKYDELLASITDVESAQAAVPELKKYKKLMMEAGFQVGLDQETKSRKATALKIEIDLYRSKRKADYQQELRRLSQLPGVADVLYPVLQQGDEENKPKGPPGL